MGDDAEYYMEQQEEEKRFRQQCQQEALYRNKKFLVCFTDGCSEELWDWEPLVEVPDIFFNLHSNENIGSEYFLSIGIPERDDDEYWDEEDDLEYDESGDGYSDQVEEFECKEVKVVGGFEFFVPNDKADGTHEVLILSQNDVIPLKNVIAKMKSFATSLIDRMIIEMIEEVAAFMEGNVTQKAFIFTREI